MTAARAVALSDALVRRYRDLVVPLGGYKHHVQIRGRWLAGKWNHRWSSLTDSKLRKHLDAGPLVAVRWSLDGRTRHAVIDIDSPLKHVSWRARRSDPLLVTDADDELRTNLALVLRALGDPPHVVIRSSSNRGLHVYLFFDRDYPAFDVYWAIHTRLEAAGLGFGVVDKVFPSEQALRLPLGRGSCILDDSGSDLVPIGAREVALRALPAVAQQWAAMGLDAPPGAVQLRRDVTSSVQLLDRLAAASRIALSHIAPRPTGFAPRGVVLVGRKCGGGHVAPPQPAPAGLTKVPLPGPAPAQAGQRYAQSRATVRQLFRQHLPRSGAMAHVEAWLRNSAITGTSKTLKGAKESTIQRELRDLGNYWDWLARRPQAKPPRPFVAMSTLVRSLRATPVTSSHTSTPRSAFRRAASAAVTANDDCLLSSIGCAWTRKKVRVLVGLLRLANQARPGVSFVTIGGRVLDRVVGGRQPPARFRPIDADTGLPATGRKMVLIAARQLGYLRQYDQGIHLTRASLFRFHLP